MHGHIRMSLLKSIVFPVVMQVIPSNDDCPLHLQLLYNSSEDTATNVYSTGKGAFFVDVCSFNGLSSNQA